MIEDDNTPSYIDYIKSEQNYLHSEKLKKDSAYWEEVFNESPSLVSFSS